MNKEQRKEYYKIYKEKHPELLIKKREYSKIYSEKHRKELCEKSKLYREKNKDIIHDKQQIYMKKNRDLWLDIIKNFKMDFCSICGYSKCFEAIEFHHKKGTDKINKTNGIAGYLKRPPRKERIDELKKCISVCANCHREIHWVKK